MGANDVCDICGDGLNFFCYFVVKVQQIEGLTSVASVTKRICERCITDVRSLGEIARQTDGRN